MIWKFYHYKMVVPRLHTELQGGYLELSQLRILGTPGTPVQLEVDLYALCRSFGQHPADESCYSLNLEHKMGKILHGLVAMRQD